MTRQFLFGSRYKVGVVKMFWMTQPTMFMGDMPYFPRLESWFSRMFSWFCWYGSRFPNKMGPLIRGIHYNWSGSRIFAFGFELSHGQGEWKLERY